MGLPPPQQRRIVPPVVAPMAQVGAGYTPPKPLEAGMARWKRNVLVWGLGVIIILVAVVVFVNLMLPAEMRKWIEPYVR
jgi:hypothetical protein